MGTSQFAHCDTSPEGAQPSTSSSPPSTWLSPEAAKLTIERHTEHLLTLASHELRTPLTTVGGNLQLAMRRLASFTESGGEQNIESALELLGKAKLQLERLNALIDQMISARSIHEGKVNLQLAPVDLAAIVLAEAQQHRLLWPGRTIKLGPPEVENGTMTVLVNADVDHISHLVANYLSNALKFSPPNTPIVLRLEHRDAMARISVCDQGPGLPPEEHERVWERFYRVPGIRELNGSSIGFGLGLYICQEIATLHGGQVGIESEQGHGSTFWFALNTAP